MDKQQVLQIIKKHIGNNAQITIDGEGCNLAIKVISDYFIDMPLVQRQKTILSLFKNYFSDGTLHALSVKAYTTKQIKI